MALNDYLGVPFDNTDTRGIVRNLLTRFNQVLQGKMNAAVEFTPTAATTSTVVTDERITPNSVLFIEPTSQNGAVELAAGTMYITAANRGAGECTITHSTGAGTELFRLLILS